MRQGLVSPWKVRQRPLGELAAVAEPGGTEAPPPLQRSGQPVTAVTTLGEPLAQPGSEELTLLRARQHAREQEQQALARVRLRVRLQV